MTDDTPTTPADRPTDASSTAWGAAPAPTSTSTPTSTFDPPDAVSTAPSGWQQGNWQQASWQQSGPNGPTPWYGTAATSRRKGPKPPWFWPIVAVVVGLAALLVGGGVGFAVGHAIGGAGHSTTQVPGTNGGTDQLPGGGTGRFPGNGTQGGTGTQDGSGTGTGTGTGTQGSTGTGSDTSGSAANS